MLFYQVVNCPPFRQGAGVPEHDLIVINTYLDGDGTAIILMGNRIEKGFPQGFLWNRVGFDTLDSLV